MFHRRPIAPDGQPIGLLGGSFDPAHGGHAHISRIALNRLRLNRIWWLVSPGNPLKLNTPAPLERRMDAAHAVLDGTARIIPTDIERVLDTVYTVDTIHALKRRYPRARFIWLMGADNLVQFNRWHKWEEIMHALPIAVMARPGEQVRAGLSVAARRFAAFRVPAHEAAALPYREPPCWTMLTHPTSRLSSTSIRAKGGWQ